MKDVTALSMKTNTETHKERILAIEISDCNDKNRVILLHVRVEKAFKSVEEIVGEYVLSNASKQLRRAKHAFIAGYMQSK